MFHPHLHLPVLQATFLTNSALIFVSLRSYPGARWSVKYGGPEGRPSRECPLANVLSPVALCEHSLANALSLVALRERSLVTAPSDHPPSPLARTFSRAIAESFSSAPLSRISLGWRVYDCRCSGLCSVCSEGRESSVLLDGHTWLVTELSHGGVGSPFDGYCRQYYGL